MTKAFLKLPVLIIILLLFSCSSSDYNDNTQMSVQTDSSLNGVYKGLQYDGLSYDPAYPGKEFKSYHEGLLKIKGDSIYFDQYPLFVNNTDTSYSASDGGFFNWRGTKEVHDTSITFNLTEYYCDYCGVFIRTNQDGTEEYCPRQIRLNGKIDSKGFFINGYLYQKIIYTDTLASERPKPGQTAKF